IITSDPKSAYDWALSLGRPVVYKPLSGAWHADEGQARLIYTTPVAGPGELLDPAIGQTAHMFQEQIDKQCEARAIVVGSQVFTVRIDAHTEAARQDWRADYDGLSYALLTLPPEIERGLLDLHCRLGLVYGAVDLICDRSGRWVFLETNQSGEWGWLAAE